MKSRSEILPSVQTRILLRLFAYATDSYEPLDALRQMMGHVSIETTVGTDTRSCPRPPIRVDELLASPRDHP